MTSSWMSAAAWNSSRLVAAVTISSQSGPPGAAPAPVGEGRAQPLAAGEQVDDVLHERGRVGADRLDRGDLAGQDVVERLLHPHPQVLGVEDRPGRQRAHGHRRGGRAGGCGAAHGLTLGSRRAAGHTRPRPRRAAYPGAVPEASVMPQRHRTVARGPGRGPRPGPADGVVRVLPAPRRGGRAGAVAGRAPGGGGAPGLRVRHLRRRRRHPGPHGPGHPAHRARELAVAGGAPHLRRADHRAAAAGHRRLRRLRRAQRARPARRPARRARHAVGAAPRAAWTGPSSSSSWSPGSAASRSASPRSPTGTRSPARAPTTPGSSRSRPAPARVRRHPVLLRRRRLRPPGRRGGGPGRRPAGAAGDHARDEPPADRAVRPAVGHAAARRPGRPARGRRRRPGRGAAGRASRRRPCCARSCWPPARPGCTSTRSTPRRRRSRCAPTWGWRPARAGPVG